MNQIIAVSAESVIASKKGEFESWVSKLPATDTVVIIVYKDESTKDEQLSKVNEYKNIAHIRLIDRNIALELFLTYGNPEFFGGFRLGAPASLDRFKNVTDEIASGV